jgi:hypothetical protein
MTYIVYPVLATLKVSLNLVFWLNIMAANTTLYHKLF